LRRLKAALLPLRFHSGSSRFSSRFLVNFLRSIFVLHRAGRVKPSAAAAPSLPCGAFIMRRLSPFAAPSGSVIAKP
jgi:hypothetical protein